MACPLTLNPQIKHLMKHPDDDKTVISSLLANRLVSGQVSGYSGGERIVYTNFTLTLLRLLAP
jgi:hypothetical protein